MILPSKTSARINALKVKRASEVLKGGRADHMPDEKFNRKALRKGTKHEREHTRSKQIAKEIAKDHLDESKSYYRDIDKIEGKKASAWTRSEGQNPEGGLNEKGRRAYARENPGRKLKRPVSRDEAKRSPVSAKRRASFCARMSGMKKRLTSKETANDPNSRINKSLRKWDC